MISKERRFVHKEFKFSDNQEQRILELHALGLTSTEIGQGLSPVIASAGLINKFLDENNLKPNRKLRQKK